MSNQDESNGIFLPSSECLLQPKRGEKQLEKERRKKRDQNVEKERKKREKENFPLSLNAKAEIDSILG